MSDTMGSGAGRTVTTWDRSPQGTGILTREGSGSTPPARIKRYG